MNQVTNTGLLPQSGVYTSKDGNSKIKISRKALEINQGKNVDDILEALSHNMSSLTVRRAQNLWKSLDSEIKYQLAYCDAGTFNLDLSSKLKLRGDIFHDAFVAKNAKIIFCLDVFPISSTVYEHSFLELRSELLSVCNQLKSSGACNGKNLIIEFLKSFDTDVLASLVRHEVARHFIDECNMESELQDDEMKDWNWDEDFDSGAIPLQNDFQAFENAFIEGGLVPSFLHFTHWLYYHASEVFENVRTLLTVTARERSRSMWARSNRKAISIDSETLLKRAENYTFKITPKVLGIMPKRASLFNSSQNAFNQTGIIKVSSETETQRLVRLYCATNPLADNLIEDETRFFGVNSKIVAFLVTESGYNTESIQTFEHLKQAVWDVVGFTELNKWVDEQQDPTLLLKSSGTKKLFNAMNVLGKEAFHGNSKILDYSLEKTRAFVERLYGWLNLVKIFNAIASRQASFKKLASVKSGDVIWQENMTCCTLILQAVLNTQKLSFTLKEIGRFCSAIQKAGMSDQLKTSFRLLAKENKAEVAVNILEEYVDTLVVKGESIFSVAEDILISSSEDLKLFDKIRLIVRATSDQVTNLVGELMLYSDARETAKGNLNAQLLYLRYNHRKIPEYYTNQAHAYFNYLLSTIYRETDVEQKQKAGDPDRII